MTLLPRWLAALGALPLAGSAVPRPRPAPTAPVRVAPCDSTALRSASATVRDTLRLRMRRSASMPTLPRPWADLVVDEIGSRIRFTRPLPLAVYDEVPAPAAPLPAASLAPAPLPALVTTIYDEVRVVVRRDGRVARSELMTRSLSDLADQALLAAVAAADSSRLLPGLPATAPESTVVFLSLTRAALPKPLGASDGEAVRDVALLTLPRFDGAELARPAPNMGGPRYPAADREARRQGRATVSFVIDESGMVAPGTMHVVSYSAPSFATAVLDFLPQARFQPATVGGCPVRQLVQQPFDFLLYPGAPPQP